VWWPSSRRAPDHREEEAERIRCNLARVFSIRPLPRGLGRGQVALDTVLPYRTGQPWLRTSPLPDLDPLLVLPRLIATEFPGRHCKPMSDSQQNAGILKIGKKVLTALWASSVPVTWAAKRVYTLGMLLQFAKDWRFPPNPEWYNHELDIALFEQRKAVHFFERGVYASEVTCGKRVLDLCCGDGSVSALFVAPEATAVYAVDFDRKAIAHAQRTWRSTSNLKFAVMDIRDLAVPEGGFDVVLWDAAIEHFTQEEMKRIFGGIKRALAPNGILHGSTVKRAMHAQHHEHEYEFESLAEMEKFLSPSFKFVSSWERVHPERTAFYFRCSDAASTTLTVK
jgi:SAM-dependent methyltransferase